jgi:hypothetical protein
MHNLEERLRGIEELVRRFENVPDPESRRLAQSLLEAVLELHGAGLERMLDIVYETGDSGQAAIRRLAGDNLVSSLLLLHNLHPDDLETRVLKALGKAHGHAELIGIFDGVVRIRLTGAGCGLKQSVEAAVRDAAPDAPGFLFEESPPPGGFVPVELVGMPLTGRL